MKSKFSEQELKERTLELLYGLLDEDEAEELRRLIASDATAARIFDEAREAADRFARAARWEEAPEAEQDETAAKNVAVESVPFDGGASLAFDAARVGGDAFSPPLDAEAAEAANFAETDGESSGSNRKRAKRRLNLLRKNKTASKNVRSESGDGGKRGRETRKERLRAKAGKSANLARTTKSASASQFRFGSKERVDGESGWATVGRTASGDGERRSAARRFWARVPKPTLFQNLIIALAVVALSTAVGFWAQETALQARFRDDFRIQIAAPRTLARGESQTISATTTAPNGKPRRVPIRFSFSDAETGAPLLAHTESGDASGVARFKIPDVSDFPARTRLTIDAGEREKETFETILTVVDAPKPNDGANAAARFAASEAVGENAAETIPAKQARTQKKAFDRRAAKRDDAFAPFAVENERALEAETRYFRSENQKAESVAGAAFHRNAARSVSRSFDIGAAPVPDGKMGAIGGMNALSAAPVPDGKMGAMGGMDAMGAAPVPDGKMGAMGAMEEMNAMGAAPVPGGKMGAMGGMDAMGAPVSVVSQDSAASVAFAVKPETASRKARTETLQDSSEFARSLADRVELFKLNGQSIDDGEEAKETFLFAESNADVQFNLLDGAPVAPEKRGLDVRFYPVGERLVAGRENVVWFECVDEAGRPVVGEFALNDSEGRVATAKTSEGGVGSLRWTPDVDETYSLETAFDGKIAKIVETDKNAKTAKTDNGKGGDKECVAAEEAPLAALALNDSVEDWLPASTFEKFRFPAPTPTVERVAFSVASQVLASGESVEFEIWSENETPLAATVEKNGVALAQRVWTAKKGRRRVVVPLDADVSGVLNVSLWNCARAPFERIGSAAVYRKPAVAPTLAATLERDDAGKRALRIAVDSKKGLGNAESVRLKTFWAPTLDAALGALELDEALLYASDERRAETLGTLSLSAANEPVLFDNLLEMKESALKKLNAFWLGEAGLAGRVVGLGFLGCAALAALTVFCVLLGALKARRGAVVVLFCAALATFFYFERRRIDFSETLSEAIAVSVDASKAAQKDAPGDAPVVNAPNDDAEKAASPSVRPAFGVRIDDFDATKPAIGAEWSVPLTGELATTDVGFVLVKMSADDGTRAWKAISLSESGEKETEEGR